MRILIIRHAEPDYTTDTLTEKGKREALLLSERLSRLPIRAFYVSTMGRARETAAPTIRKMGSSAPEVHECDWLREFPHLIHRPDKPGQTSICWDWLPQDWIREEAFLDRESWMQTDVMKEGHVEEVYRNVTDSFDAVLASHGYHRSGLLYRAESPSCDILAFFCHFGLECVLLSHLMNVSPMILWHYTCALTSSVTSLYTEERREGTAIFRMNAFGDTSHLYAGAEEPSFLARFCETWNQADVRHD